MLETTEVCRFPMAESVLLHFIHKNVDAISLFQRTCQKIRTVSQRRIRLKKMLRLSPFMVNEEVQNGLRPNQQNLSLKSSRKMSKIKILNLDKEVEEGIKFIPVKITNICLKIYFAFPGVDELNDNKEQFESFVGIKIAGCLFESQNCFNSIFTEKFVSHHIGINIFRAQKLYEKCCSKQ
ncbi:CLUMA_CG021578, isoform A [Clunio marinus]|uniref:CLUMA_CG021578, isoform A n=1 Tax=Clunio marinus TaxID=568069 RepID=A0A1J1J9H3_9DIPT|nr:CLUMA_CG021578, isoform A [Clunio marinus]